eukprot:UN34112
MNFVLQLSKIPNNVKCELLFAEEFPDMLFYHICQQEKMIPTFRDLRLLSKFEFVIPQTSVDKMKHLKGDIIECTASLLHVSKWYVVYFHLKQVDEHTLLTFIIRVNNDVQQITSDEVHFFNDLREKLAHDPNLKHLFSEQGYMESSICVAGLLQD